jgi:hypothetical protein
MKLYLGLVHHPIKNKLGELVTTSVTNLDIHDIARSCRTFGVKKYFIITPFTEQKKLVDSILGHWEQVRQMLIIQIAKMRFPLQGRLIL